MTGNQEFVLCKQVGLTIDANFDYQDSITITETTITILGLNEIYVWFLLPTYPNFFTPTLNIKMVYGEKIPKMGTFSEFVTIFFVKCYNKI